MMDHLGLSCRFWEVFNFGLIPELNTFVQFSTLSSSLGKKDSKSSYWSQGAFAIKIDPCIAGHMLEVRVRILDARHATFGLPAIITAHGPRGAKWKVISRRSP